MCSQFAGAPGGLPDFSQGELAQLEGSPLVRCQKALTGNCDPEAAMEWLFAQMEDPVEIDDPIVTPSGGAGGGGTEPSAGQVGMLVDMGRLRTQARNGATACARSSRTRGPGCTRATYVTHIRTESGWVLFNDEKVAGANPESVRALKALAYLYVLERIPLWEVQRVRWAW
ncbi:hypothetical protein EDB86DRAFT_3075434 [Lactarius hatsudake]|nr:hypothetical protein EDB86DRAFT_3075434 [Lactarius hatsudake]